jgi:hypothetical protein
MIKSNNDHVIKKKVIMSLTTNNIKFLTMKICLLKGYDRGKWKFLLFFIFFIRKVEISRAIKNRHILIVS